MKTALRFALCVLLCFVPAVAGVVARPDGWYFQLVKPALNPPPWVFAPVWTMLYLMMGVALFLHRSATLGGHPLGPRGTWLFAGQLLLNGVWSPLFFGLKSPVLAAVDIVLLLTAIVLTQRVFFQTSRLAGWLLAPYLAWVSFATYLNVSIAWLNRG